MNKLLKHPWLVVAIIAIITVFFAMQLPRLKLDNDLFNFIPRDDPARLAYQRVENVFGGQTNLVVGVRAAGGTVYDKTFLDKLGAFTTAIEELPHVDSVTGLTSADYLGGEGGSIVTSSLIPEDFSGTAEEITLIKEKLMSWDLYRGSLVSEDSAATQLIVTFAIAEGSNKGEEGKRIVYEGILKARANSGFEKKDVVISGMPVFAVIFSDNMRIDLAVLIPLVALVVIGSLAVSFRRLSGVLLPLVTVMVSAIWTMGLVALVGTPLTMIGTVIPVILMAVGSAYGIHAVNQYYEETAHTGESPTPEGRAKVVLFALSKVRVPIILAAVTTLAGFASNIVTTVRPIQQFGFYSSFGVLVAVAVALTLVPALLVIRKSSRSHAHDGSFVPKKDKLADFLAHTLGALSKRPKTVAILTLAFAGLSLWGTRSLIVDSALVEYFKPDAEAYKADLFFREKFAGTKSFTIVVRGKEKGDLNKVVALKAMDDLAVYLQSEFPEIGKIASYTQLVKRINQVINADESPDGLAQVKKTSAASASPAEEPEFGFGFGFDDDAAAQAAPEIAAMPDETNSQDAGVSIAMLQRALIDTKGDAPTVREFIESLQRAGNYKGAAYYEIPSDPKRYGLSTQEELASLVSNYLVLLASSSTKLSDDPFEPSSALMTLQMRATGNASTKKVAAAAMSFLKARLPEGYSAEAAGAAMIEQSLNDAVIINQAWSVGVSLLAVFLILVINYKSLAAGLIGLVPLGLTVLANFGIMGWLGIKLDISTALVSSLAIGIGIDYTIHYLSAYCREHAQSDDLATVRDRTMRGVGKAILFNAFSVGAGFLVLALSRFNPLMYLGILIAITMVVSSMAALIVLPIILDLSKPKFASRRT